MLNEYEKSYIAEIEAFVIIVESIVCDTCTAECGEGKHGIINLTLFTVKSKICACSLSAVWNCKKVYLIVRKDYLRASKIMQQRVFDNENIEVLFNTNTVGLFGEDGVEGAHLVRHKGTENEEFFDIDIDGFFLAIGHKPNTDIFKEWIELDEAGYIKVDGNTSLTNVEGVFAAGDVADPRYRQGITAAGMGAKAAIDVERFLLEH